MLFLVQKKGIYAESLHRTEENTNGWFLQLEMSTACRVVLYPSTSMLWLTLYTFLLLNQSSCDLLISWSRKVAFIWSKILIFQVLYMFSQVPSSSFHHSVLLCLIFIRLKIQAVLLHTMLCWGSSFLRLKLLSYKILWPFS